MADCRCGPELPVRLLDPYQCDLAAFMHRCAPTVVGTPASTIVFAAGYLKPSDFLKVGSRMVVVSTLLMLLTASLYWPLIGA